jgi:hypothetical protein
MPAHILKKAEQVKDRHVFLEKKKNPESLRAVSIQ